MKWTLYCCNTRNSQPQDDRINNFVVCSLTLDLKATTNVTTDDAGDTTENIVLRITSSCALLYS